MSQEAVEKFLGRLLTDDLFRKRAEHSIEAACIEAGYALNSAERSMIHYEDLVRLRSVASQLDAGVRRFSGQKDKKQKRAT